MKTNIFSYAQTILFLLCVFVGLSSCSKDDEDSSYRNIRYEVTGDVSTPVSIQYTPTVEAPNEDFDSDDYQEVSMLPWQKEVRHHHLVQGASCSASIGGGIIGEQVTIRIFRENELVATHEGAVNTDGYLSILVNYYIDGTVDTYSF